MLKRASQPATGSGAASGVACAAAAAAAAGADVNGYGTLYQMMRRCRHERPSHMQHQMVEHIALGTTALQHVMTAGMCSHGGLRLRLNVLYARHPSPSQSQRNHSCMPSALRLHHV
jgi:hypothetical protein